MDAQNFMLHLSVDVLDKVLEVGNLMEIMIELYLQADCVDELLQNISEIYNLYYLDKNAAEHLMKREEELLYLDNPSAYLN